MMIIITTKNARNTGIIRIPSFEDNIPKRGGIKVDPKYALAIWTPIIAWEFSAPKLSGVEWIMDGYTGAHPSPIITQPARENTSGRKKAPMSRIPTAETAVPSRIIPRSLSLSEINPETKRPIVIPMQNRDAKAAARSFVTPLVPIRKEAIQCMQVASAAQYPKNPASSSGTPGILRDFTSPRGFLLSSCEAGLFTFQSGSPMQRIRAMISWSPATMRYPACQL